MRLLLITPFVLAILLSPFLFVLPPANSFYSFDIIQKIHSDGNGFFCAMHVLFCHNDIFHRNLLVIHFMLNRLTPLVGSLLARHFNCQMREPAVRCCAMPMFHFCRNVDAVARFHFYRLFSFFLIITASCHADKNLSATAFCVMDVPVIAASRFKCYIKYANLLCRYRCKITLSDKIPGKSIVWLSDRKYHRFGMRTHCLVFIRKISFA